VTLEEHGLFRALAFGLLDREILYVTLMRTSEPLDPLIGRSYVTLEEHVSFETLGPQSFRTLALGTP
jgi:hypothetical protein